MSDIIAQTRQNISYISQAISATQQLRSTVTNVFTFLCEGVKPDEDQESKGENIETVGSVTKDSKKFLHRFQEYLQAVNQNYNEVEKFCNCMITTADFPVLGPSGILSQDSVLDKSSLYRDASLTYQWNQKLHEYAQIAYSLMQTNPIKKSQQQSGPHILARRRRPLPVKFNTTNRQHVEGIIQLCTGQLKQDVSLKVILCAGEMRTLQLTVGHVFNAIIVLRSLYLEKVLVRGLDEDIFDDNGKVDLFTPSQFECMKKISDHATSAMLEYSSYQPNQVEVPLRYILVWLQSYKTLFIEKCSVCGKHLFAGLPPLWKDFRSPIACHDTCKP